MGTMMTFCAVIIDVQANSVFQEQNSTASGTSRSPALYSFNLLTVSYSLERDSGKRTVKVVPPDSKQSFLTLQKSHQSIFPGHRSLSIGM